MIQDIFPHRLHNEFQPDATPSEDSPIFYFSGSKLLVKTGIDFRLPRFCDFGDVQINADDFTYLISVDEEQYFLYRKNMADTVLMNGFSYREIKELREQNQIPKAMAFATYTAKHLSDWYRDNRFCGRCGKPMVRHEKERAMTCKSCGYTSYPRIMPAVIVGVVNGDALLITKYRVGYRHNALVAGFTEIGETVEETVAREVMEEAGIRVKNIRYYKSQPWGIANDILLGFYCEVDGDPTIRMDEQELSYAEWTKREEIVLQPDDYSLTNEMMARFKHGGKKTCR